MRLFIAVNFDGQTKENLLLLQSRLRKLGSGSFSRPENLHLTLAFLGEVAPRRVAVICRLMDQITFSVLRLTFGHLGCFKREGGDIWWAGLAPNRALTDLQEELSRRLTDAGFPLECRRFSPHITLARRVVLMEEPDKNKLLEAPFSTDADSVSLMLSEKKDGKLTYTQQYAAYAQKD